LVRRKSSRAEIIVCKRAGEHIGGQRSAQQAVINASAGRRLYQACSVADRDESIAVCARNRGKRKNLLPGPADVLAVDAPAARDTIGKTLEVAGRLVFTHDADACATIVASRHWNHPSKSLWGKGASDVGLD